MDLIKLPTIKAAEVVDFSDLKNDSNAMLKMMDEGIDHNGRRAGSVALHHAQVCAAPFNFFVLNRQYKEIFDGHRVIVNAKIVDQKDLVPFEEGCLSFLGRPHLKTRRFKTIKLTYQTPRSDNSLRAANLHGDKVIELTGFAAFVVQHELDHAAGINIYDGRFDEYNARVEMSKEA